MDEADSTPKVISSSKGTPQLLHRGFVMFLNRRRGNTTYFRCGYVDPATKYRCTASAAVDGELIEGLYHLKFHNLEAHIHPPDFLRCDIRENMCKFREAAVADLDRPIRTVLERVRTEVASTLPDQRKDAVIASLPSLKKVLQRGYRARQKLISPSKPKRARRNPKNAENADAEGRTDVSVHDATAETEKNPRKGLLRFPCPACGRGFSRKLYLFSHYRNVHQGRKRISRAKSERLDGGRSEFLLENQRLVEFDYEDSGMFFEDDDDDQRDDEPWKRRNLIPPQDNLSGSRQIKETDTKKNCRFSLKNPVKSDPFAAHFQQFLSLPSLSPIETVGFFRVFVTALISYLGDGSTTDIAWQNRKRRPRFYPDWLPWMDPHQKPSGFEDFVWAALLRKGVEHFYEHRTKFSRTVNGLETRIKTESEEPEQSENKKETYGNFYDPASPFSQMCYGATAY